jgi:hypothetical protein
MIGGQAGRRKIDSVNFMNAMLSIDCWITAAESPSVWYDAPERAWALPVRGKGTFRHLFTAFQPAHAEDGRKLLGGAALHWAGDPALVN